MSFFVDVNVVVYAAAPGPYREACGAILDAVTEGEAEGRMSTAALEEIWHLELSGKAGTLDGLTRMTHALFTPLLPITDGTVALALSLDADPLGANDRIHVATCLENGIDTIVTADAGFDGVRGLRRVDPLDTRELSRVLSG